MAQQKNANTSKLNQRNNGAAQPASPQALEGMRLDKWLWCARFYKTRTFAAEEIGKGRLQVNQSAAKASREVKLGDTLTIIQGPTKRIVVVKALSGMRGPAPIAQQMYEETADSIAIREKQTAMRQLAPEPAEMLRHGRPTKKDRRDMQDLTQQWGDGHDGDSQWQPEDAADTEREPRPRALNERWSSSHK